MKRIFLLAMTTMVFVALGSVAFAQADKMTGDELLTKHLASIGTPEDIAAVKTLIFSGDGTFTSNLRSSQVIAGQSQFGSEPDKLVFALVFNSNDYPYEKIAYDGKTQTIGFPNGGLSALGSFFKAQSAVTKYGFFGGELSRAWALYDVKGRKIKLDSASLVKVDGKQLYKVKYSPGNDFRIAMYFEADTFRHVKTEYEYTIQAGMISSDPTANVSSKQSHFKMSEEFGDFKAAGKLTLPYDYTIRYEGLDPNSNAGSRSLVWHVKYKDIYVNEPFQPGTFKVG